jgi:hypothetical protein
VIWIGDTPLVEMEALGHNRYKFYAFEQTALPEGATIAFGWPAAAPQHEATSAQRVATNFRFRLGGSPSGVA